MKVLVVDDVNFNRHIVVRSLEHAGYKVVEAVSGMQGVEQLTAHQDIGAVITDHQMPGMTGIGFFKHCKETFKDATPPFVMLTGTNDVEAMKEAKLLGFHDILVKPFDIERALKVLAPIAPPEKGAQDEN